MACPRQGKMVPDFIHVMSTFRNAGSGEEFVAKFLDGEKALTGTYQSEWMVADYNKVPCLVELKSFQKRGDALCIVA